MYIQYNALEELYANKLDTVFGVKGCLIEINPGKVLLPPKYQDIGERILNLEVKKDDVWLVSYPRTGSTWTQEMVWCICNDLNYEAAKTLGHFRNPLLELTAVLANEVGEWKNELGNSVEQVETMASPRFIKTHLPWELLPTKLKTVKPKIVYVARNPKDMCVSYYHYLQLVHNLNSTFEEFCELFLHDKTPFGPIWNHIIGFWKLRNEPHVLFLKYEDMKKDHRKEIKKTSEFLGHSLSEEQIDGLMDHLSFKKMRENPALNLDPILQLKHGPNYKQEGNQMFIRKGQVGGWRSYMSEELSARFDQWTEHNLKGTGLSFETDTAVNTNGQ